MKPGKGYCSIISLCLLPCLFTLGSADLNSEEVRTKIYEPPWLGNSSILHCGFNQYYDDRERRCIILPGGGTVISVNKSTTSCIESLRPHPSFLNCYYVCRNTKTIFAKCSNNQYFDNRLKECATDSEAFKNEQFASKNSNASHNHVELPPCLKPGIFPIQSDDRNYYTCTFNGIGFDREIQECPSPTTFDSVVGSCITEYIRGRDRGSKIKPATIKNLPVTSMGMTRQSKSETVFLPAQRTDGKTEEATISSMSADTLVAITKMSETETMKSRITSGLIGRTRLSAKQMETKPTADHKSPANLPSTTKGSKIPPINIDPTMKNPATPLLKQYGSTISSMSSTTGNPHNLQARQVFQSEHRHLRFIRSPLIFKCGNLIKEAFLYIKKCIDSETDPQAQWPAMPPAPTVPTNILPTFLSSIWTNIPTIVPITVPPNVPTTVSVASAPVVLSFDIPF